MLPFWSIVIPISIIMGEVSVQTIKSLQVPLCHLYGLVSPLPSEPSDYRE